MTTTDGGVDECDVHVDAGACQQEPPHKCHSLTSLTPTHSGVLGSADGKLSVVIVLRICDYY
jgi:hypothetical protein